MFEISCFHKWSGFVSCKFHKIFKSDFNWTFVMLSLSTAVENGHVGSTASLEMVDAQEVHEGSEPNTRGEYTKWPAVTGVTTDATNSLWG